MICLRFAPRKFLEQEYAKEGSISSLRRNYGRYGDFIKQYGVEYKWHSVAWPYTMSTLYRSDLPRWYCCRFITPSNLVSDYFSNIFGYLLQVSFLLHFGKDSLMRFINQKILKSQKKDTVLNQVPNWVTIMHELMVIGNDKYKHNPRYVKWD